MNDNVEHNIAVIAQELQNISHILYVFSKNHFETTLSIRDCKIAIDEIEEIVCPSVKYKNKEQDNGN
jgi:hypothetical protein